MPLIVGITIEKFCGGIGGKANFLNFARIFEIMDQYVVYMKGNGFVAGPVFYCHQQLSSAKRSKLSPKLKSAIVIKEVLLMLNKTVSALDFVGDAEGERGGERGGENCGCECCVSGVCGCESEEEYSEDERSEDDETI